MKYKAVLLDFDGTIADTTRLIVDSWQHTYRTLTGREGEEEFILSTFGETLRDSLQMAFPEHDVQEAVDVYKSYQMSLQESAWFLFPGIREMLRALKEQGYLVGVVTSRTGSTCRQGLASCGIEQYIDALVTCDDTTAHKPDPEPALIGLGQLRGQEGSGSPEGVLTAEEALFVGDTRFDIDCAHNAGIPAALVAWSATMKKEDPVQTWPAEYYLESPEQLVEILRG